MTKPTPYSSPVFGEAFNEYRGRLYQYLRRRLANEDDAQELAQEAFLRLLRVSRVDLVADPQAYLYRIARNLMYEQCCKKLPSESWADESELQTLEDTQQTPEAEVERSALKELLEGIIAELPPRNQSIVLLFCNEGLSQREIGHRLGLSKSMVQKCLAQGIAHCRKRLRSRVRSRKGIWR